MGVLAFLSAQGPERVAGLDVDARRTLRVQESATFANTAVSRHELLGICSCALTPLWSRPYAYSAGARREESPARADVAVSRGELLFWAQPRTCSDTIADSSLQSVRTSVSTINTATL